MRREDLQRIHRYDCLSCERSFSEATLAPEYGQKKRLLNEPLRKLLCSGMTQRRIAEVFQLPRRTVVRKFIFLSEQARLDHENWLRQRREQSVYFDEVQFDEMETFEHTKCKPLSVPLIVCKKSRRIVGLNVASMPANGPLAKISRRKYGFRPDDRGKVAKELFGGVVVNLQPTAQVESDQNPKYPAWIKSALPTLIHKTYKGRRGCVVGQGELKKVGFDPLFALNHTAAMLRANLNRLVRRTWCTTKKPERLLQHLYLYTQFHNRKLSLGSPL